MSSVFSHPAPRSRVALRLALTALATLLMTPALATAAPSASAPDSPYETRGTVPLTITVDGGDPGLTYSTAGSANSSVGPFTVDGTQASADYTPNDGFAGLDSFEVLASDGVNDDTVEVAVTVRPTTVLVTGPNVAAAPAVTIDNTPTFTYKAVTGDADVAAPTTYRCSVDGGSFLSCNGGSFTAGTLTEGAHTFAVRAATNSGLNVDPQPDSTSFTVDTIAPSLSITSGRTGRSTVTDATYVLEAGADADVVECRLISPVDGDPAFDVCPVSYSDLDDGAYTFEARATDPYGNTTTPALARSFTVDTTGPGLSFDDAPVDGDTAATADFAFSSDDTDLTSTECRLLATDTAPEDVPAFTTCSSPVTTPALNRTTTYRFEVQTTDDLGNQAVHTYEWYQSNTAPVADDLAETVEGGGDVLVTFPTADDADGDAVQVSALGTPEHGVLDGNGSGGSVTYTADEDFAGVDTFSYTVTDGREGGAVTKNVAITLTPQTSFTTVPPAETNDQTPTWTFGSGVADATFQCTIDAEAPVACDDGTFTPAVDLTEGAHTFSVEATAAGLTDPTPATDGVTIDVSAPDASITDQPDPLSNDRTPTFAFESTDPTATFECRVDTDDFEACESGDATTSLADGDHTFEVRAVDPGTNVTTTIPSYTWEVDATAPVVARTTGVTAAGFTNVKKPTWTWTREDAAGNLVADSERCRVDTAAWTSPCPTTWQQPANLSDGQHTLSIEASDAAGNTGELSYTFTVDTIAPDAVITDGPSSPSGPTARFEFASGDSTAAFMCRLAGEAWQQDCLTGKTFGDLASGSHKFELKSVDPAGNESPLRLKIFTVIAGAPDTTIVSGPSGSTTSRTAAFGFFSDDGESFECRLDDGPFTACEAPKSLTGLALGAHTFAVRTRNAVGALDPTPATRTWTIVASPEPDAPVTTPAAAVTPPAATPPIIGTIPQKTVPPVAPPVVKPPAVCSPLAAKARKGSRLAIGKGLFVRISLSHTQARSGQRVKATLVIEGKGTPAARKKALAAAVRSIVLTDGGKALATLTSAKPSASFAPAKAGTRKLAVKVNRKRGKAVKGSLTLSVKPACA